MRKILALIILLLSLYPVRSQKKDDSANIKTPKQYKKSAAEGRKIVAELMAKETIPGFSIAVSVDGKIVWSEGFGYADLENHYADLENHIMASPQTRFRVGSISKLFTATAVAKLYEQGVLELDAPVQKYVPGFPKKEFDITSRQLVGHLAGIRHYKRDEFVNRQHYDSVQESLNIFKDDPLLHQPETKYLYSSRGFVLLSAVIEGATKQDYLSYMQEKVFAPLKMQNTVPDDNKKIVENRAGFYAKTSDNKWNNEVYGDSSDRWGAGGFISTAEDLVRFGSESLNGSFLKPETRSLVFTPQKTKDGKETGVGFGWRIGKDDKGRTIYSHGGESLGGRAFLIVYPESKVVVAMLSNLTFARFAEAEAGKIGGLFIESK